MNGRVQKYILKSYRTTKCNLIILICNIVRNIRLLYSFSFYAKIAKGYRTLDSSNGQLLIIERYFDTYLLNFRT